jgi:hypothetical protein
MSGGGSWACGCDVTESTQPEDQDEFAVVPRELSVCGQQRRNLCWNWSLHLQEEAEKLEGCISQAAQCGNELAFQAPSTYQSSQGP